MNPNEELITKFYTAFQKKDTKTMGECYDDSVVFNDPAFTNLKGNSARAMWMMLVEKGTDTVITFSNVKATEKGGSADWVATYHFSKSGRLVENHIHAEFEIQNGKIVKHTDHFNFWKWATMALGLPGLFLGFTPIIKGKVQSEAMAGLELYMKRKRIK